MIFNDWFCNDGYPKGKILQQFLKRSVALTGLSTNLWSSDAYFLPPCTTFKYHVDVITDRIGWVKFKERDEINLLNFLII